MSVLDAVAARLGSLAVADAPLGERTTYRVGGSAALLAEARSARELDEIARALAGCEVPVLVVGRGSNLLVADRGFYGVAVVLAGEFEAIDAPRVVSEGVVHVRAGAAVALPVLARRTVELSLRGLEWAVGVPGSVGGAVRMNAGGHGADVAATIVHAELVDLHDATHTTRSVRDLDLAYRHSNVAATEVVTHATFEVAPGDVDELRRTLKEIVAWRREHQPGGSNAGSVFVNPPGDAAGRLVEAAGAKGMRLGTASVSDKHANFIQADAKGSADDVVALIAEVRAMVLATSGVALATELVLVGFDEER